MRMSEQIDIDINVNMNNAEDVDELTAKLDEANSAAEDLTQQLADMYMGEIDGDVDALESELAEAESTAEELQSKLDEIGNTTVEPEVNVKDNVDEVNDKLESTSSTADNLTTSLAGVAGVVGIDQMIGVADRINTSYNQLELTFNGTGTSVDTLREKSAQAAEATGRSGGQVREYFNQMGIAGITNSDLLASSFESLAGRSYQTGQSIEGMESKVQKMVMTGNASSRMLTSLGITTEDLGTAMGVTGDEAKDAFEKLDPQGRLEVLTQAMGDGKQANDMYKDSYAGLKQQAETAMAGLMGAVGQGILPVVTPIIQGATDLVKNFTNTFKNLPGPVQGAVGSIGGFLAVGAGVLGSLGLIGQVGGGVVNGLKNMKGAYDGVKGAMGTAKAMMDALRNSESITEGVRAALAIATGAEATAEGAGATAKTAAIAPTTGLAIAENSLLLPLLLVAAAIVAVVAVLWYLYNTNETVRNGINWLIAQIQGFISGLQPVIDAIMGFAKAVWDNIGKVPGYIQKALTLALAVIAPWTLLFTSQGRQAIMQFINIVGTTLGKIKDTIANALAGVVDAITKPFRDAWSYVEPYVTKIQDGIKWITDNLGFEGFEGFDETLNASIVTATNNGGVNGGTTTINNNFNGLVEESAADYIVGAVNDRLRKEKLLRGA